MLGVGILGWQKTSVPQSCHPGTAMLGARSSAESPQTLSDDLYQASLESPYWPKFLAKNVTKLTSAAFSWKYLTCPRRYRHRYLDGWQEKDVRAAMLFGRCFEQAVAALFRHEDPAAVLFEQWTPCKNLPLVYSGNDTWDHMFRRGNPVARALRPGWARPDSPATEPSTDSFRADAEFRRQLCRLRRCHRRIGYRALRAGVEDHLRPLSRGA